MSDSSQFRMMHTMLRVKDLDASIIFYTTLLGMELLRRDDYPGGQFTNAFVGYGPEDSNCVLELTFNWGNTAGYDQGNGYGHIALGVRDIHKVCADLEAQGAKVPRKPGPMLHGTTHIAFIEDPDGYRIELVDLDTMG